MNRAKAGWYALVGAFGRAVRPAPGAALRAMLLCLALSPGSALALNSIELRVPGGSDDLMATLRASSLLLAAEAAGRTDPVELMPTARAEYGRLIGLLYEHGHYAPTIDILIDGREAADISPLSNPRAIDQIVIAIDLGPLFTFGEVSVSPLAPGTVMPEGFATGQPARSVLVQTALATALDAWRAQGHAHAEVHAQNVVANHNTRQLNVRLVLSPGSQLRFGAVVPQGNERTRSERIVAIAGLPAGDVYDPEDLAAAETRLRTTGTFASVVMRTSERENPDGTVDVEARVVESPPRRLGFGAEYDTEAGVRLSGFWLHRNLFGGAERLRLEASVDGIGAQVDGLGFALNAAFTRPATIDRDTDLEIGVSAVRLIERDYDADSFEITARLVRQYSDALSASLGFALRFEVADYGAGKLTSANFGSFGVPFSVTHDTRDNALDARTGHYLWIEAMPYAGFGQTQSGLRLQFDSRLYADLGTDGRVVLAGRAQVGAIYGSDLANTPRGFLFYTGGGGSVRGMPYQSLGVTSGGVASGGRSFASLSGEVRVRMTDTLTLAAFADAGRVSSGVFNGASDWQAGGGFGIRYNTPIGPLRLDLATPLRRNATALGSSSYQIYLGIGQSF